jgi:ribosomal protein L23
MKILNLLLISLSLSLSLHADHHEGPNGHDHAKVAAAAPLRHVVMFKFKETATKEQVAAIEKAFGELPKKIKTITGYEWGTNVSKENKNEGFTHCFVVTFKDQKGLDVYVPHAAHQAFVKLLLPSLDKVLVLDFFAK